MKILFCHGVRYPFIGIMSLSAVLKEDGHETALKIFNLRRPQKRIIDEIMEYSPDLVALPAYTGWHKPVIEFCRLIKKRMDIPTIVGGPHATYYPDILKNDGIDYICVGEGEVALKKLVAGLKNNGRTDNILGIWLKKDGRIIDNGLSELPDLTALPHMDIDLYCESNKDIRNMKHREFSLNRGCMYKCRYCVNRTLSQIYKNNAIRSQSPLQAVNEIKYVFEKYPFLSVTFVNDTLFLKKSELKEFLALYKKEINLPFFCNLRIEMINDEVAEMLKDARCNFVAVGIESGSPRVRREILNRNMQNEEIINGIRILRKHGIGVNANSMLGIPGESFEEAFQTIELVRQAQPVTTWCSIFQPYPGTELTNSLLGNGELKTDIFDEIPASFFDRSVMKRKGIHQFVNLQRFFYFCIKYPRLTPLIKILCKFRVGRLYDIFFLWSFYDYLRKAHKESPLSAVGIIFRNAIAAFLS